jgi:cyclophilin family peptidyl-prolyl cis-trans isomerase/HEAT repeat protein
MRTSRPRALTALVASVVLAGCVMFGAEKGPPKGTYRERLFGFAGLLRMEDRRAYDPLLAGRTAASPDPWLRAKTALTVSRLKDPDASVYLPVLLKDAEAPVRRAATFGAGLSGDARLLRFLVAALGDSDGETAANAAEALGKTGGKDATDALLAALAKPAGPRPASALALFRMPEARTMTALLAVFGGDPLAPELRRAVVYSLSRKPDPAAASALRAVLRRGNEGPNPPSSQEVAWAARGLGILEDEDSIPDLVALARSPDVSVAVQALGAVQSLSRKISVSRSDELTRSALEVALARANDSLPGVAIAGLRLLGALPDSPASRATLEQNLLRKGWRGQAALVSLTRLDAALSPEAALKRLDAAAASDSLELRLGAVESLEFLKGESAAKEQVATALLSDRLARVRAAALSSLSKQKAPKRSAYMLAGLIDREPAVRAVALEESAPLVDEAGGEFLRVWKVAYEESFALKEPDFIVSALDAAAARKAGGRDLVRAHEDDADAVTREKARRLLVENYGAAARSFRPVPVATRLSTEDYERVARAANESFFEAEIGTERGAFRMELLAEDAPLTVESFRALAAKHFFDGMVIHRVVPDFVVQTGDPRGDGSGGPLYAIRDEINPARYTRGAVGMALSGADTGGSQWFVALSSQLHLDGGYTKFGHVLEGWDVLERIEQDDRLVSVRVTSRPREVRPPGALP